MTYMNKPRRMRLRPPQQALSGDVSDFFAELGGGLAGGLFANRDSLAATFGGRSVSDCIAAANQSDRIKALDDKANDLAKNWQPTGFYTPDQIDTLTGSVLQMLANSQIQVQLAPRNTGDADTVIAQANDDIVRKVAEGQVYVQAGQQARANAGGAVNAPGLKRWVTTSMSAASDGLVTAMVQSCSEDYISRAFDAIEAFFQGTWQIAKAIVGIAADAGKFVVKVPDLIGDLVTVAKVAVIAGGAYFIYTKWREKRGKRT